MPKTEQCGIWLHPITEKKETKVLKCWPRFYRRTGCSGGVLHPESGTADSLSAISFLPCFVWSVSTHGEEPLWETLAEGRCPADVAGRVAPLRDAA